MYVNVDNLSATGDNVVLKMIKWPASFVSTAGIVSSETTNSYDNGRELYLAEVKSSANEAFEPGDFVAINMYYGVHVPSEVRTEKIKIVPATGIVLKSKEFKVMSDITKMDPGIDRIFMKLRKKEAKTAGGIYIPDATISADPTAQDVRIADVVKSGDPGFKPGETVIMEAFVGQDVYLDEEKDLYIVCYAADILAKINKED